MEHKKSFGEIVKDNLEKLDEDARCAADVRNGQLYELAYKAHAARLSGGDDMAVMLYRSYVPSPLISPDFAKYVSYYVSLCENGGTLLEIGDFYPDTDLGGDSGGCIFMRSSYTDEAFAVFQKKRPSLFPDYADSVTASLDSVFNSTSLCCILPISNTHDGTLQSFKRLVRKYGLKLCETVSVPSSDGEYESIFGLFLRSIDGEIGKRFFEISTSLPENVSAGQLLSALEALPVRISHAEIPFSAYSGIKLVFELTNARCAPLFMFLKYALPEHTAEGYYNEF